MQQFCCNEYNFLKGNQQAATIPDWNYLIFISDLPFRNQLKG